MDIITTAIKIEAKIAELEQERDRILPASFDKATAISNYDKEMALTIVKLRNGVIKSWEGQDISNLPATLIIPVAKGICFQECFSSEIAENNYKGIISIIEAIKAELNGLQSINKHLE